MNHDIKILMMQTAIFQLICFIIVLLFIGGFRHKKFLEALKQVIAYKSLRMLVLYPDCVTFFYLYLMGNHQIKI